MRLYLDSAPVIYTVEQVMPFATAVDARLGTSGVVLVASDLTRLECIIHPLRNADPALLQDFDDFFSARVTEMVTFTRNVFQRAAEIRAQHNFKTPDALHLAAAVESACDVFFTNDTQLARFTAIAVEVI